MFQKINLRDLSIHPFALFHDKNLLAGAGTLESHNFLTIGWGCLGNLWSKDVLVVYVKPSRYSYAFFEESNYFSVMSFPDDMHNEIIKYFGTHSGRNENKEETFHLTPFLLDQCVAFEEASCIITCKKIYQNAFIEKGFKDKEIVKQRYADHLFHHEYVGEIIGVYKKETKI